MGKKKTIILFLIFIIIMIMIILIITGGKRTDVVLKDFLVSKDGTKITLHTMVTGSAGYTRKLKIKQGGDNKYITFYSTYGINSNLGAKSIFEVELDPFCREIYFYKGDGGYKLVLKKDTNTNQWGIVK